MSISVSTLVKYLKNKLDSDNSLQNIEVTGELSNFHKHSSGHLYFSLKDDKSQISCVMFASKASSIKFEPKNGDEVIVKANTSLFEVSGQLQLYVNSLKLKGIGDLYQQYEELKNKLYEQGYFDDAHKKELEIKYPNNVCVLVGDKSAAMSDIKTCFNRRWPLAKVDYYPVLVQGKNAPNEIIDKLIEVDKLNYDYIILARGGGSFEDLFCFNDENLVKTIYNLQTFIITGIGHEQDYTLVDFVADLRAPTPTATVELTTPNINDEIAYLNDTKSYLNTLITNKIENLDIKLDYFKTKITAFTNKYKLIDTDIKNLEIRMNNSITNIINNSNNKLKNLINLLNAYSLDQTLKRGFSLVYSDKKIIKSKKEIKSKDELTIKFIDGESKVTVK